MSRSNTQRAFKQPANNQQRYDDQEDQFEERNAQKPKGNKPRRNNPSHQKHNKSNMDAFQERKGNENRSIRQEEIKKELFVGLDDEAMARLAEPQTLQPIMLPITSRGVGLSTVQLAYTAKQYNTDIRVPSIYSQYGVYLGSTGIENFIIKVTFYHDLKIYRRRVPTRRPDPICPENS